MSPKIPERYRVFVAALEVFVEGKDWTEVELNVNLAVVAVAVSSFKVIFVPDAPAILFQLIAGTIPGLADAAIVFDPL